MRPVFSDLVAEIQRSIGFFTSNNRNAKLGEMVALGNPMKLPGLQRFLSQNLDQQVKLVDQFNNLATGTATAGPQYKENQLTFGVAYGLCVQAQEHAQLRTNLLPDEIITTRLVKAKKPWAVAAVALLLVGLTINYFMHYAALLTANKDDPQMATQIKGAQAIAKTAADFTSENTTLVSAFDKIVTTAKNLQSNVDGRLLWLELFKAIDAAMPKDMRPPEKRQETEKDIAQREELHIEAIECEFMPDITPWQTSIQRFYTPPPKPGAPATPAAPAAADAAAQNGAAAPAPGQTADAGAAANATPASPPAAAPTPDATATAPADAAASANSGWIIELRGYHLHNNLEGKFAVGKEGEGEEFLKSTIIKNLELSKVKLPDGPKGELIDVSMPDLGIKLPVVVTHEKTRPVTYYAEAPENAGAAGARLAGPGAEGVPMAPGGVPQAGEQPKTFKLRKYRFVIQFCWQPQPRGQRLEKMAQKKAAAASTAATAGEAPKSSS
jgi:type IV pilus assembly protein PilM